MSKPYHKLYLIRHGESEGNVDHRAYDGVPDSNIPLTEIGKGQSTQCGLGLNEQISPWGATDVFVTPYLRGRQTWEGIHEGLSGKVLDNIENIIEDPRIREHEYRGKLGGFEFSQIREMRDQGRFFYRFEGGESMADCYDRTSSFLMDRIEGSGRVYDRKGVIVSHGTAIRTLMMRLLDWTVDDYLRYHTPKNCSIIELTCNETGVWSWTSGTIKERP